MRKSSSHDVIKVEQAQEELKLTNAKIDTFEDIVQTMHREKHKNQEVVQENVKLHINLKEIESEIISLNKKLELYKLREIEKTLQVSTD